MFKNRQSILLLILILGFFFLLYQPSFTSFFSQDDFYYLSLARANSLVDVVNFFNPQTQEVFYFRPLGTQLFFLVAHGLPTALAPIALRLVALSFHLANFYLIFKLLRKILKQEQLAMVLAGAYLIAPLHFMSLYYISAFQQILAAFWQLLGFWFFVLNQKRWIYLFFILALLSKETALIFPALLLIFSYIIRPEKTLSGCFNRFKKEFSFWLFFIFIIVLYGLIRLTNFTASPGGNYQFSFSPRTLISSWRWYLVWLIGAPETITRYAGRILDFGWESFLKDSGLLGITFLGTFLATILLVCLITLLIVKKKLITTKIKENFIIIFYWLIFFVISLLPVSFFPYHRYSHYLDLVFFALLIIVGKLFLKTKRLKILWVLLFLAFLANAWVSVSIDQELHWTTGRSEIAQRYFGIFQNKNLCLERGVYFVDSPSLSAYEASLALLNHWGPAYFCHYQPPPVYYQGINSPSDYDQVRIIKYK